MSKTYLRKAKCADVDLLFEWTNDNEVRKNSFNSAKIDYEGHRRWFKNCLEDGTIDLYICCLEDEPVGQIRLNYNNQTAVISYSIASRHRGKGFGVVIVKLIEAEVIATRPDITFLLGSVKLDNIASQRIFEECGYHKEMLTETEEEHLNYRKLINSL